MITDESYSELAFYTLLHPDQELFIHQYVVDAWTAQQADEHKKRIAVIYALVGLYLFLEKGYSGKQVQQAHVLLSKDKSNMPQIRIPAEKGGIRIDDVLKAAPGPDRDTRITEWCHSVWNAYQDSHQIIADYLSKRI